MCVLFVLAVWFVFWLGVFDVYVCCGVLCLYCVMSVLLVCCIVVVLCVCTCGYVVWYGCGGVYACVAMWWLCVLCVVSCGSYGSCGVWCAGVFSVIGAVLRLLCFFVFLYSVWLFVWVAVLFAVCVLRWCGCGVLVCRVFLLRMSGLAMYM